MGYNIERIVKTDEGKQIKTCYILNGIFVANAFRQLLVGTYFIAKGANPAYEIAVCHFECGTADTVSGIEQCSVRQNDTGGEKNLVAIGVGTAVHAGSIVHDDTAYHGAFNGSRVRSEFSSEGR